MSHERGNECNMPHATWTWRRVQPCRGYYFPGGGRVIFSIALLLSTFCHCINGFKGALAIFLASDALRALRAVMCVSWTLRAVMPRDEDASFFVSVAWWGLGSEQDEHCARLYFFCVQVGDTLGLLLQNVFCLAFGYLIAFVYDWRMALVVTGALPFIIFGEAPPSVWP